LIDLSQYPGRIKPFLNDALRRFAREHPDVCVNCVALYACPWAGWISLYLDTPAHAEQFVRNWRHRGPTWYGVDAAGAFCNNCPDFAFVEYALLEFEEWIEASDAPDPLRLRGADGFDIPVDPAEGDQAFNRPFFDMLVGLMEELPALPSYHLLARDEPFRAGVQLLASDLSRFWPVQDPA